MTRQVRELAWVRRLPQRPSCIPQGRPRGAKRDGVRYETTLADGVLLGASKGVWFEFADANGHGYAQVDFLIESSFGPVVAEAKLTWTPAAYVQLRGLYLPLLRQLYGPRVGGLVVCASLTRETPRTEIAGSLSEALARSARGEVPVLRVAAATAAAKALRPASAKPARIGVPKWWGKDVPVLGV